MKKRKANHYCNILNIDYIHTKDQMQVIKFTLASAAERNLHGPNFINGFYWFYRWVTADGSRLSAFNGLSVLLKH